LNAERNLWEEIRHEDWSEIDVKKLILLGMDSYPYPVKEGQRYINLKPWPSFCSAAIPKGKGSRGSFKLLRQRLQQGKTTITPQD